MSKDLESKTWKIFYNPACSKCREALAFLQSQNLRPQVIEYLKDPPSKQDVKDLIKIIGCNPRALLRTKESLYSQLACEPQSADAVAELIAQHPSLLQRPIVIYGSSGVIARPVENIKSILASSP